MKLYSVINPQTRLKIFKQKDKISLVILEKLPLCSHFHQCGGCTLQHLSDENYDLYKSQKVFKNLEKYGFDVNLIHVHPLIKISSQTRRRVVFKFSREKKKITVGFCKLNSHVLVDIQHCFTILSEIESFIDPLREFFQTFLTSSCQGNVFVTSVDQGLDVLIKFLCPFHLSLNQREQAVCFAQNHNLVRFTIDQDSLYCRDVPKVNFADYPVEIHADGFLQASSFSDKWLGEKVCQHLPTHCQKIADLFCGYGTLTFPLSKIGSVKAYDVTEKSLNSLRKTSHSYRLPIDVISRDLFRHPLSLQEMKKFDAIVLNPPRDGAFSQSHILSKASVPRIIMVSCYPLTFARDAQILCESNYQLTDLYLFDQFLWSEHIEVLGVFEFKKHSK